ncbi:MAG: DUF881 domain-containing protein [Candidatus Dormibacteraeota bacterium]|nr:DUF881 domain-containing protein [Candidatus Dormibacteraeota bacterium]
MRNRSAEQTARAQRLIAVSVIAIALGFLLVVQLRSQAVVARTLAAQDNTSVALLINDLNRANNQLLQQSAALTQQEASLQQALIAGGTDAKTIEKELTLLQEVGGEVPVHGPGIEIHLDGTVMDFELQDALNSLRNAGAEAFSLNGHRIVSDTPIQSRGQLLTINGYTVRSPYVLRAIGGPEALSAAAEIAVTSLQTRLQVAIARQTDIAITDVVAPHPLIYAQLGK